MTNHFDLTTEVFEVDQEEEEYPLAAELDEIQQDMESDLEAAADFEDAGEADYESDLLTEADFEAGTDTEEQYQVAAPVRRTATLSDVASFMVSETNKVLVAQPKVMQAGILPVLCSKPGPGQQSLPRPSLRLGAGAVPIRLWIKFANGNGLPSIFRVPSQRGAISATAFFSSLEEFTKWVMKQMRVAHMSASTVPVPGGHRNARAGDVLVWKHVATSPRATQPTGSDLFVATILGIRRAANSGDDMLKVAYYITPRTHWCRELVVREFQARALLKTLRSPYPGFQLQLVGSGPRRFSGFKNLR